METTKTFSIAELEKFTLIRAHTFRVWERRYDLYKGRRTVTNVRYYTLEDLAYLLNLALLNRYGYKISLLAGLNGEQLAERLLELNHETAKQAHCINKLIIYTFSLVIEDFELTLEAAIAAWGMETTVDKIILPFLERLELFGYKGRSTCEYHFVVTALRKKLITAIEQAKPVRDTGKSALLFLPEGENFDLLLLYLNYQLRKAGLQVLYLGTDITTHNLQAVIRKKQPHYAVTYISPEDKKSMLQLSSFADWEEKTSLFVTTAKLSEDDCSLTEETKLMSYKELLHQMNLSA